MIHRKQKLLIALLYLQILKQVRLPVYGVEEIMVMILKELRGQINVMTLRSFQVWVLQRVHAQEMEYYLI